MGIMSSGLWKALGRRYGFSFVVQGGLLGRWSGGLCRGETGAVEKEKGFGWEICIKSMKSPWWKGGVGRKSEASNMSSPLDGWPGSIMGAVIPGLTWSSGEVVPPSGPVLGSRRERSASSRRGYMSRVRYEADGGGGWFLGLSRDLLRWFCAAVVLMGLVTPAELRFLLPDLDDGL